MEGNYSYYAETPYGYTIKVLTEVLHSCLTNEAFFRLEKSGIKSVCSDNRNTTLINVELMMENFDVYNCKTERTIAVNLKHLQRLLKNVKKKDTITLFITDKMPNKLGIRTVPIMVNKKSERADTSYISIREVTRSGIDIPEGYYYPKVIPATEYQKMCKKMGVVPGKIINITIQENNYISFFCDGGDIISSELTFGSIDPKLSKNTYEGRFYITILNQLIKMPGLSPKMQISAPKDKRFPIRIKMQAGNLGFIEVYLKTKEQIEYEEHKTTEQT